MDPEQIHDKIVVFGERVGKSKVGKKMVKLAFDYSDPLLHQKIAGIFFANPVGLAAGFDKNGQLINILPSVGFGFMEVGSVTGKSCKGNPLPRLWRLKKSEGLLVHYGLKNDGSAMIAKKLEGKKFEFPIGISVAKTNSPATVEFESGIADYLKGFVDVMHVADFITLNISCPNAFGGCPFTSEKYFEGLLENLPLKEFAKPIFIKLSPDLSDVEIDSIISISKKYKITGFVCSNLTKERNNLKIKDDEIPEVGGMSGKVVQNLADELIAKIYRKTKGESVIIGCGGVFDAKDAYRKIRLGASLVQLITGMIFEGPQLIGEINRELVVLLKKDGFSSINEAVGIDIK